MKNKLIGFECVRWIHLHAMSGGLMLGVLSLACAAVPLARAGEIEPNGLPTHGSISSTPATVWEQAFVSGNGRMGAVMFGNPANDTIIASHCRLFVPLGNREIVPDLAKYVPELRSIYRKIGSGRAMEFLMAKGKEQGYPGLIPTDPCHPGLFINIHQRIEGDVSNYRRTEDFATGEVDVRWRDARGEFRRRMFVSRTDNLIVLSLTGPAAGGLDCELEFPHINHNLIDSKQVSAADWVTYHNVYVKGKGGFDSAVRIVNRGGKAEAVGDVVKMTGVDEVLMFIRIAPWKTPLPPNLSEAVAYSPDNPDFKHPGEFKPVPPLADSSVVAYLKADDAVALMPELKKSLAGVAADYSRLLAPHAKAHGALFNRVALDLGGGADRMKTSEELLDIAGKENRLPPALMEKMYDAGRYMYICSAGELLPNLQGIWAGSWTPMWSGDFTLDTNVQSAMASALSANLPELMEGYFRLMESFYPEWRINAQRIYGCRGFFSNPRASNTCLMLHWGGWDGVFWTAGSGWLASFFSDYAQYTGDRKFLEQRCVPLLKGIAEFYEDFLAETDQDGKAVFIPSFNPETGSSINATMDIAVAREVLINLIADCRELKIEGDNLAKWEALLARLPAYPIDKDGQLAEIPGGGVSPGHRHHSMLYPCFQSFDPIIESTPSLWKAAQTTVRAKIAGSDRAGQGDEQSSFGRIQCGVAAAYLRMPEEAYGRLKVMAVKRSMNPSLITSHEPAAGIWNTDGNGGIPQIANMMLAFSQPGRLDLLPALPAEWPKGEICGMLCRGQVTINRLAWDKPAAKVAVELTSSKAQILTLCLPNAGKIESVKVTGAKVSASPKGDNYREVTLQAKAVAKLEMTFTDK